MNFLQYITSIRRTNTQAEEHELFVKLEKNEDNVTDFPSNSFELCLSSWIHLFTRISLFYKEYRAALRKTYISIDKKSSSLVFTNGTVTNELSRDTKGYFLPGCYRDRTWHN